MKIVFFGTPEYVLPILEKVHKAFSEKGKSPIVAVVTQKPKPTGRKKILTYSAIDKWAHKKQIPRYFKAADIVDKKIEANLGITASYGEIIPKKVINHFPHGILNIHPSLLPKFRGASPVQASIITGQKTTGVTIVKMDEKLDHGSIVAQYKEDVLTDDTTETLRNRLFKKSAEVLTTLIPAYIQGKIKPRVQDHQKASFTRELTKKDGFIPPDFIANAMTVERRKKHVEWEISFIINCKLLATCYLLHNFIRAMHPWPQTWTYIKLNEKDKEEKRLKILKAHLETNPQHATRNAQLKLDIVQLEGKNPITWQQFRAGYPEAKF